MFRYKVLLFILAMTLVFSACSKIEEEAFDKVNYQQSLENTSNAEIIQEAQYKKDDHRNEYLTITTTAYRNGINDSNGVDLVLYSFDIGNKSMTQIFRAPTEAIYPANAIDYNKNRVFFADGDIDKGYDNLFLYDMATGETQQLTYGKYRFDDLILVDGELYANVAREGATVCQPAKFNFERNEFSYLNELDDDTWYHSFSYNYNSDSFLVLTCSNAEMRSHRVVAETHIRPKTISTISRDFTESTPLFFTDAFEIRLTRQLNDTQIIMAAEPYMGSRSRSIKVLTIDTQHIEELSFPNISVVYLFYPTADGQTLFFIGKAHNAARWQVYQYSLDTAELHCLTDEYKIMDDVRTIVDIQYTIQ